ncbi:YjbQ family protein [Streptomyces sp. I6]|uniref:YjbQ family protein n=1 Tax=Streptomyces sp. NPDC049910 TaxID=3155278 RepID=UPI000F44671F|nr:YjbQ family protein [Streptomyces sp. I6]RNL73438.1 YjbQ family protein [Streptomyces sp. I6]
MAGPFATTVMHLSTGSVETVTDLTAGCEQFLTDASGGRDGLLSVFAPHTTAGIAVIETGAGTEEDLLSTLHHLLPADDRWCHASHAHDRPGHGRDHVVPALVPPHATFPVVAGRLAIGSWQSICLVDTNPANSERQVRLSFLG